MMINRQQRLSTRGAASAQQNRRFWEIDALRGVAIIMMVIYHLLWDLYFFAVLPNIALQVGFWKYYQRTTASLFLTLVGVSLVVSYKRATSSFVGKVSAGAAVVGKVRVLLRICCFLRGLLV